MVWWDWAKSVRVGNLVQNKDHNCHDSDSFSLLLAPRSPSLSAPCPGMPSLPPSCCCPCWATHTRIQCALWRRALLFTRYLHQTPIYFARSCFSSHLLPHLCMLLVIFNLLLKETFDKLSMPWFFCLLSKTFKRVMKEAKDFLQMHKHLEEHLRLLVLVKAWSANVSCDKEN